MKDHLEEFLDLSQDPFDVFRVWYSEAQKTEEIPSAMALSTVGVDGNPNIRFVLLKDFDRNGLTFYTNYKSVKGREIERVSFVAVAFWWNSIKKQVKIRGSVYKISPEESEAYFHSRPREAQIAAWASEQSAPIKSYAELLRRFEIFRKQFENKDVPRPPHWGGYRILPQEFEFLVYSQVRLHKRVLFERQDESLWRKIYLCP